MRLRLNLLSPYALSGLPLIRRFCVSYLLNGSRILCAVRVMFNLLQKTALTFQTPFIHVLYPLLLLREPCLLVEVHLIPLTMQPGHLCGASSNPSSLFQLGMTVMILAPPTLPTNGLCSLY